MRLLVRTCPSTRSGLEIRRGGFGEVMLGLGEIKDGELATMPARQMSDGMLGERAASDAGRA